MNLTKEQMLDIYAGTKVAEVTDMFFTQPANDYEYVERMKKSKLWRLNNLYTIVDKKGNTVKFDMNIAQHKVYAKHLEHPRLLILKSRQQGISTLWLISFFDDCVFRPYFTSGLMAQGMDEAQMLLSRTRLLWDNLSPAVKRLLNIQVVRSNTKEFTFTNNSTMFIRTSFRSATLQGLHISEYGKIANANPARARETKTGTLQTTAIGNTVVIETTAEGENDFKVMWERAVAFAGNRTPKDFIPVFLPWTDDPSCNIDEYQEPTLVEESYFEELEIKLKQKLTVTQKNFWIAQHRELGTDVYQEYPATPEEAFLRNRDGTYYAAQYLRLVRGRKREVAGLFDRKLPVQVAVDLGRNDDFVLIFFQTFIDGWRIINSYNNMGEGIEHYCRKMKSWEEKYGYDITKVILPHDAHVRDMTSNITREESFWEHGYRGKTVVVPRTPDINNDIEIVRRELHNMHVDPNAQYIIDCLLNYSKEWDDRREIWKDKPEHNKYSHGADALRQMVRGGLAYRVPVRRTRSSGEIAI